MAWIGGAISGAGSLLGGLTGSKGSKSASSSISAASMYSALLQYQMYQNTQSLLSPYTQAGTGALSTLQNIGGLGGAAAQSQALSALSGGNITGLTFNPTMAQLQQTPGYQWTVNQAQRGVENAASAQGRGLSGAQLQGAASAAEQLAATNWGQQQQTFQSNLQNILSIPTYLTSLGQSSAAGTGAAGQSAASTAGSLISSGATNAASASMSGYNALANALSGGASSAASNYLLSGLLNQSTSYTGPSASVLQGSSGSPSDLQSLLGLSSNQFVSDPRAKAGGNSLSSNALDRLNAIPVSDARYADEPQGSERPMFMAPDVQRQMPNAVTGIPNGPALQTVRANEMLPAMLAGIQELDKKKADRKKTNGRRNV